MGARGPAPKLRAVREREGKLAHRPLPTGIRLPPALPAEPRWESAFTVEVYGRGPAMRLRNTCRAQWKLITASLGAMGVLAEVDAAALEMACTAFARFRESIRAGEDSAALKWFAQWVSVSGKVGLTPSARDQMNPREGLHDATDLFD